MILYGFIATSGVKMLLKEKVDLNNTKNIFVASVILVAGIGGLFLKVGPIKITSTAVAMILDFILNLLLKEKKINE